ncbi:kinetochore-associated protein NSL1 homolog [Gastrophryne carolinensis]
MAVNIDCSKRRSRRLLEAKGSSEDNAVPKTRTPDTRPPRTSGPVTRLSAGNKSQEEEEKGGTAERSQRRATRGNPSDLEEAGPPSPCCHDGKAGSSEPSAQQNSDPSQPNDETRAGPSMPREQEEEAPSRDRKVQCCSKQLLQEVLGMCSGICQELLSSQHYLTEEQRQQLHTNLAWDLETAFQENVSINGLSWHDAPDKDSEPNIKILEDQLDELMVETARKRKRYPRKILSHYVKKLKTEREVLNLYKPVVKPEKVALDAALEQRMKDLSTATATICQQIHETKKALPAQLKKAEGFSQVLALQPTLEGSQIRKDIFSCRVMIKDILKSTPKALETTPLESKPQDRSAPTLSLRRRKVTSAERQLYPLRSKRKIRLET